MITESCSYQISTSCHILVVPIATFCKLIATATVLSREGWYSWSESLQTKFFVWWGTFTAQYATVCQKISQMTRYGTVKLSKSNITWQIALQLFITISFLCSKPFWIVLIKNGLGLETFFLQNGLSNTPLVPLNYTTSMELSKIIFSSDCV